jgi:hypothetical protein
MSSAADNDDNLRSLNTLIYFFSKHHVIVLPYIGLLKEETTFRREIISFTDKSKYVQKVVVISYFETLKLTGQDLRTSDLSS